METVRAVNAMVEEAKRLGTYPAPPDVIQVRERIPSNETLGIQACTTTSASAAEEAISKHPLFPSPSTRTVSVPRLCQGAAGGS